MSRVQRRELAGAPTLTIDVIALLHSVGLSAREIRSFTPIVKRHSVLNEIGEKIIDKILKNTLSGNDKDGKPFISYSPKYVKSTIFKIWKGRSRKVNLKLKGDMHADLSVVSISEPQGVVTVGFTDEEESNKAKGHITGANYLPRRDFFGLKKQELKDIMLKTIREYEEDAIFDVEEMLIKAAPKIGTEGFQDMQLFEALYGS